MCVYCVKCTKFGKLFLRKVIETVATRCLDFSSERPKMRLAAGLCPVGSARTRWGSLSALPCPLAAKGGLLLRGGGREGREGGDGREGKGEGRGGILPDQSKSGCYGPASQLRVGLDSYQQTTVPIAVANVYLGITPKQHTKTNKYTIKQ